MYKLLEKIRRQPENVRKIIAASIVAILMAVIGWAWIFTMRDNFDFNTDTKDSSKENISVISPLESLKENFAAFKNLPLETGMPEKINPEAEAKENSETGSENNNFKIFEKINRGLNKSWHWAYDPLKK